MVGLMAVDSARLTERTSAALWAASMVCSLVSNWAATSAAYWVGYWELESAAATVVPMAVDSAESREHKMAGMSAAH